MMVSRGTLGRAALAGMLVAWATPRAEAENIRPGGVSLELPEGWHGLGPGPGITAAWARPLGSGSDAILTVEIHERASSLRRLPAERQAIERILRADTGVSGFRLLDGGPVEADGVPAYRIRGRVDVGGLAVEQLQLIIPGPETTLLTFSWEEGQVLEGELDAILRSARIDRGGRLLAGHGAGGLALVIGLVAGIALASRKRRVRG